jgi:hypothetical protein
VTPTTPLLPGSTFEIAYPFVQETVWLSDDEGPSVPVLSWRPGTLRRGVSHADEWHQAEGMGTQLLTVISTHRPGGRYQERVFYTQQWRSPDGKVFGKRTLRVCGVRKFRGLLHGFRFPYSLPGEPSPEAVQQAEYDEFMAAMYAEEAARESVVLTH